MKIKEEDWKPPEEVGREISKKTLKSIWRNHFGNKPFPDVRAFIIPEEWYDFYEHDKTPCAAWVTMYNNLEEYGKKCIESEALLAYIPENIKLLKGNNRYEIYIRKVPIGDNDYYDDILHELRHINERLYHKAKVYK